MKVAFKVCPTRLHFAGDLGRLIQFARLGVVCINLQELGKNWIEAMFLYRGPSVLISIASKPLGNVWRSYDDCLRCLFSQLSLWKTRVGSYGDGIVFSRSEGMGILRYT